MKILSTLVLCLALCGCGAVKSTTPPAALAPGAISQFDSDTYRALATSHAVAQSAAGNAAKLTTTEKAALNQFIQYLNIADSLFVSFHRSLISQPEMQAALDNVTNSQAAYQATITGGK